MTEIANGGEPLASDATLPLFTGFEPLRIQTSGASIYGVRGGSGPPLLLLHGWPQTHAEWHYIAPRLARDFTVVATDLRGYGDSSKPEDGVGHAGHCKRAMAQDQVELMQQLGFERFAVVGHDRGGRVGHRMALDHAERVTRLAVLDIVPTLEVYSTVTKALATAYYHWFFLIQPAPLPETLIGGKEEFLLRAVLRGQVPKNISEAVFQHYLHCMRQDGTLHAMCEDYRAGAGIDLEHDRADLQRKVACPLLVLWGLKGAMDHLYDVPATWHARASEVHAQGLNCGHWMPEELPDEVYTQLHRFLT
jgi:haloacetate dehalogenase